MATKKMNTTTEKHVVLAAIDGEAHAPRVLEHAARLVSANRNGELHIVHVVIPLTPAASVSDEFDRDVRDDQMKAAREYTDRMGEFASGLIDGEITVHLVRSDPTDGVLRIAERVEADILVVGTHDYRGVKRFFLGSVAAEIAKRAHCPVLVARPLSYPTSDVPEIEPLCPDCAAARASSGGKTLWCVQHESRSALRTHTHYEYPKGFGAGSQLLRM